MSTTAQSSDPSDAVLEMRKEAGQKAKNTHDETAEASSLQQQIENSIADETVRLPVGDARVEFRTFNGDCSGCPDHPDREIEKGGDISDMVALTDERLDRMTQSNFAEKYEEEVGWMCDVLEWSSKPDFMTAEWWRETFGIKRRREYLNLIQTERELSRKKLEKLRRQGRA